MTLGEWIRLTSQQLGEAGVDSPKLDAQLISAEILGQTRSWVLAHPEHVVTAPFATELVQRRLNREPLAYILGRKEFYGRQILCDQRALVPRPETECLVERALLEIQPGDAVLDLCCGTGCIGLTIQAERQDVKVTLSDLSADALDLCRENQAALGLECETVQSDLFAELSGRRFDIVASNPPYVACGDDLQPEVREFEPSMALFAAQNGLAVYRRIAAEVAACAPRAVLLEIGQGQASDVEAIFAEQGWNLTDTTLDLAGITRVMAFAPGHPGTGSRGL